VDGGDKAGAEHLINSKSMKGVDKDMLKNDERVNFKAKVNPKKKR
jgi:hypothetical protein